MAAGRGSGVRGPYTCAVDFELTEEQRLIQETVRSFVDERVLPNAIENDINHHLDLGVIEGMAELGLLGIVIPEEYGGAGLDFVAEALACEEIERSFATPARSKSSAT
jgi:alkylation response protein AidB-like acyl-CoA dehydrogenase